MTAYTNTQLQNLLANIFLKTETSQPFRVANAGFQKFNWQSNYTLNAVASNGNSGMSVGLVQFDFASGNGPSAALLNALISNLPDNIGGYSKDDLKIALLNFHARNIAGYLTQTDQTSGHASQAVADQAFQQLKVITAYAPYISDTLKNNGTVNAVLVAQTNQQIANDLTGANAAINTIKNTLTANSKTSALLSSSPDKMLMALADMQNQNPAYTTQATNWLIAHPDATWGQFRAFNLTLGKGDVRAKRIDKVAAVFDKLTLGKLSLDVSPIATASSTTVTNPDGSLTLIFPDGSASTTVKHTDKSSTVSTSSPNGNTSVINYDQLGNVTSAQIRTVNGDGTYTLSDSNINGTSTSTTYKTSDDSKVSESVINADESRSYLSYFPNGNVSRATITNADGSGSDVSFYANGIRSSMLITNTDGSGSTTNYYDTGTISHEKIVNADGSGSTKDYYANGNLHTATVTNSDGSGSTVGYQTDNSGYVKIIGPKVPESISF